MCSGVFLKINFSRSWKYKNKVAFQLETFPIIIWISYQYSGKRVGNLFQQLIGVSNKFPNVSQLIPSTMIKSLLAGKIYVKLYPFSSDASYKRLIKKHADGKRCKSIRRTGHQPNQRLQIKRIHFQGVYCIRQACLTVTE